MKSCEICRDCRIGPCKQVKVSQTEAELKDAWESYTGDRDVCPFYEKPFKRRDSNEAC